MQKVERKRQKSDDKIWVIIGGDYDVMRCEKVVSENGKLQIATRN